MAFKPQKFYDAVMSADLGDDAVVRQEQRAFAKRTAAFAAQLPSPNRAGLYGAGIGAAVALVSGRSLIKYGITFGLASYALVVIADAAGVVGYARGACDTCGGA